MKKRSEIFTLGAHVIAWRDVNSASLIRIFRSFNGKAIR